MDKATAKRRADGHWDTGLVWVRKPIPNSTSLEVVRLFFLADPNDFDLVYCSEDSFEKAGLSEIGLNRLAFLREVNDAGL